MFPASARVVMNCKSCNTTIDYRFLTNCAHCNCEVEEGSLTQIDSLPDPPSIQPGLPWRQSLINLCYVFATSAAGMISGAVVLYCLAAIVYRTFFMDVGGNPSTHCGRGMAVAFLSILCGAFLGTVGGSILAVKKPLCKVAK